MSKDNCGARRASTHANKVLNNLEVIIIGDGFARDDHRPGDHVLVDWSLRPDVGAIGAVRVDSGVSFVVFDGDESAIGRLVNPSRLLRVPAP